MTTLIKTFFMKHFVLIENDEKKMLKYSAIAGCVMGAIAGMTIGLSHVFAQL